jgi:hypothetical protein
MDQRICARSYGVSIFQNQNESYMLDGVVHDTTHLIQPGAIEKATEYFEDLKYGGLTRKTREKQIKEYGYGPRPM